MLHLSCEKSAKLQNVQLKHTISYNMTITAAVTFAGVVAIGYWEMFDSCNLWPYRPHPGTDGISHGLKSVHRTLFAPVCGLVPASSIPTQLMKQKIPMRKHRDFSFGDPYGNRTHVTAVKGRCLNRLTNGPGSGNLT